jgi:hypothetical protein
MEYKLMKKNIENLLIYFIIHDYGVEKKNIEKIHIWKHTISFYWK